ncbi:hypothetical protein [uncultured Kordia sp.]|uniref:hypothetical protein n=1 Tax=uncultured Kordia sp. TaxID=507699 RepID=UPI0026148ADB|nr:hypothetical protein [uncultured Kordia sp.]
MKKKNLKSLNLNKKMVSNFNSSTVKGGTFLSISCQPLGICAETQGCETDGCTNGCPTNIGCTPTNNGCNPTNTCPTISCQPIGICKG